MITADGWLDWAERVEGPADKVYHATNAAAGYIPHSAVGYYRGWAARLFSRERRPDGRYTAYAAASVHGWIACDGAVTQHYPLTASCWASGSAYPNTNFVAFENEGGFDPVNEPLTPAQLQANLRIIREVAAWRGWEAYRRPVDGGDTRANLYEHNECVRWGAAPTACPSGRIAWDVVLNELGASDNGAGVREEFEGGSDSYVVQPGDTLRRIAARLGLDWQALFDANREVINDPNLLQPGWQLALPGAAKPPFEPEIHVVQPGDTLYGLSRRWGRSIAEIVAANEIADERLIRAGQALRKP